MRGRLRRWLWIQAFSVVLTLFWSGFLLVLGEGPPPLLLLLGIFQAVMFYSAFVNEVELALEQKDIP